MSAVDQIVSTWMGGGTPVAPSKLSIESGWQDLNCLNLFLWLRRRGLSQFYPYQPSAYGFADYQWAGFWPVDSGGAWAAEIQAYVNDDDDAIPYGFWISSPVGTVSDTVDRFISDLACHLIAVLVRGCPVKLHFLAELKSRLLRFTARAYRFRNKVSLQRRFYLTHGAHPVEDLICLEGRLNPKIGGGSVAFQL